MSICLNCGNSVGKCTCFHREPARLAEKCNGCYRNVCVCAKLVTDKPVKHCVMCDKPYPECTCPAGAERPRKVPLPYPLENQIRHAIQKCAENGGDVQLTLRAAEWRNLHEFIAARHD